MSERTMTLEERLHDYPRMHKSVEALLAMVEETASARTTADEAEFQVIEAVRHLGQNLLIIPKEQESS